MKEGTLNTKVNGCIIFAFLLLQVLTNLLDTKDVLKVTTLKIACANKIIQILKHREYSTKSDRKLHDSKNNKKLFIEDCIAEFVHIAIPVLDALKINKILGKFINVILHTVCMHTHLMKFFKNEKIKNHFFCHFKSKFAGMCIYTSSPWFTFANFPKTLFISHNYILQLQLYNTERM